MKKNNGKLRKETYRIPFSVRTEELGEPKKKKKRRNVTVSLKKK
jgi:hypothetical protein